MMNMLVAWTYPKMNQEKRYFMNHGVDIENHNHPFRIRGKNLESSGHPEVFIPDGRPRVLQISLRT